MVGFPKLRSTGIGRPGDGVPGTTRSTRKMATGRSDHLDPPASASDADVRCWTTRSFPLGHARQRFFFLSSLNADRSSQ